MSVRLWSQLAVPPASGAFSDHELDGLPDPARRYLQASIAYGDTSRTVGQVSNAGVDQGGRAMAPIPRETGGGAASRLPVGCPCRGCDRWVGPLREGPRGNG